MRRLFWLTVGAAAGASGAVWSQRAVRRQVDEARRQVGAARAPGSVAAAGGDRLQDAAVALAAGRGISRGVGRTVSRGVGRGVVVVGRGVAGAVNDGRIAAAEREVELRRRLEDDLRPAFRTGRTASSGRVRPR